MDQLLQNSRHEETARNYGQMDEKANSHDLLETMETSEDKVRDVAITQNPETESMGIGIHKKELLENIQ
nr:hypothetical protein [Paenibacillus uliginis]